MKKVSIRKKLVTKLDKVFGDYIKARDKGRSVLSGKRDNIQCGHLFSRVAYSTRWDETNAFCQTAGENLRHEHDPWPFYKWYKDVFGDEQFDSLHRKYNTPTRFSNADLHDLIVYYEKKLEDKDFGEVTW